MKYYELSDKHESVIDLDIILHIYKLKGSKKVNDFDIDTDHIIYIGGGYEHGASYTHDNLELMEKDYKHIKSYLLSKNESNPPKPIEPIIHIPDLRGEIRGI